MTSAITHTTWPYPLSRIGIIGGGQLARMMALAGQRLGFRINILEATADCPAAPVAHHLIIGSLTDAEKINALADCSDVLTYDIEHINTDALLVLQALGHRIHPSPQVLAVIQDKLRQKHILAAHGLPLASFEAVDGNLEEVVGRLGYPLVQKARRGGYDGRGVAVLHSRADAAKALQVASYAEAYVDFEKELAVMVARNVSGQTAVYPVVEMAFDTRANICDRVIAPARISASIAEQAQAIAKSAVEALEGVGIFGVELFLTREQRILINEIAPRPHNSGHYTIEACVTSQFEQHLRAITDLPLGSTAQLQPAVMINLLGEPGQAGPPAVENLAKALAVPGLSFHLYGKAETRPFRKMGHLTILHPNIETALTHADAVQSYLKITSRLLA